MIEITLSESDVVCPDRNGVALVEYAAAEAGPMTLSFSLRRCEPGQAGPEIVSSTNLPARGPGGRIEVRVNAALLAPGEYKGRLEVRAGSAVVTRDVAFYRMPDTLREEFPFGIYAVPFGADAATQDATARELKELGINLVCNHLTAEFGRESKAYDRAARYGLRFMPALGPERKPAPGGEARLHAADPSEALTTASCFGQAAFRETAARKLAAELKAIQAHPAFSGAVYYGDDLFMATRFTAGRADLSCYCDDCRAAFRDRHGFDPPVTTPARRCVIPADDPWLAWMRFRCEDTYGGFIRLLERTADEVSPPVRFGLVHGPPDNPFSQVSTGLYSPLTQPRKIVSSYAYPFLRAPAQDFIAYYEMGRMSRRDAEVWMLGLLAADGTVAPPWQVRQNYWNMLAAGYKSMAFFSWWDVVGIRQRGDAAQNERMKDSLSALAQCGRHKDWILPSARHWRDPEAPFAALYSFTTESFDLAPEYRAHTHAKRVCAFYRQALRRQVPMTIVGEEETREGILNRFQAVCLPDVRVLPDDVAKRISDFAAAGGTVLADPDYLYTDGWHPEARPFVAGALNVTNDTSVEILRQKIEPVVSVSNPDITVRHFTSGTADYFVFVNNVCDRYSGMDYNYTDPNENYRRAAFVRDEPVTAEARFRAKDRWVVDLSSGEVLGPSGQPLTLDLEPSWGRVLALLPAPGVALALEAPVRATAGERVRCALRATGADGRPIDAAFTVRARVTSPSGRESPYGGFLGIAGGEGEFILPLGVNDEPGTWRLEFEGGFPRRSVTQDLEVAPASATAAILETRER